MCVQELGKINTNWFVVSGVYMLVWDFLFILSQLCWFVLLPKASPDLLLLPLSSTEFKTHHPMFYLSLMGM